MRSRGSSTVAGLVVALGVLSVLTVACGDDDTGSSGSAATTTIVSAPVPTSEDPPGSTATVPAPTTTSAPVLDARDRRPYDVEVVTLTLVDDTRATQPVGGTESASRTLETSVYLPVTDQPVPLVIFSHGLIGHPRKFERLLTAWATAGYAVAAPAFPLTNDTVVGAIDNASDVVNQPGDVVFVLDQLLDGELASRFDPTRLAAAGLSLGGITAYLAAVDEASADPRFSAAIVMASVTPGDGFDARDIPILVMHGELDPLIPSSAARATYERLAGPAYFVEFLGGYHADPFEDLEETPIPDVDRFHPIVDATAVAFWDTYLLPDEAAEPSILATADVDGITVVESR